MLVRKPIFWVPSLYFMQGIPYAIVMLVIAIMYKQLKLPNDTIALTTSFFIFPWVLKPLFAPYFERYVSKKHMTVLMEFLLSILFSCLALCLFFKYYLILSVFAILLLSTLAACHDIVSDGVYLQALAKTMQVRFVGIRTFAYQSARLTCQGGMVAFAGWLMHYFAIRHAWMIVFFLLSLLCLLLSIYHHYNLPNSNPIVSSSEKKYKRVFIDFFKLNSIFKIIIFLLIYNIAEAQLLKIVPLFLLDHYQQGGLKLSIAQLGLIYGILGISAMITGVLISAYLLSRYNFRKCLLVFTAMILLSQIGYVIISEFFMVNIAIITFVVIFAQFAFGLSNSAYMTYLLKAVGQEKYPMSFYAIGTSFMALGTMLPGAMSGFIQTYLGYYGFFIWIVGLQTLLFIYLFLLEKNNDIIRI